MTRPLLAAAAGGALYFLGYLGWGVRPCLLVFLAPLWWAIERTRERGLAAAMAVGLVFGGVAYAGGFTWLWRLVSVFLEGNRVLGVVAWLGYGAWFALGFAAYAGLVQRLRARGWPIAAAAIPSLVLVEWMQPQLFPVNAGSGLAGATAWIQIGELGGPLLLTALVAGANAVAYESWTAPRRRAAGVWLVALATAAADVGYGRARLAAIDAQRDAGAALRVGVVQANLGVLEKHLQGELSQARHVAQTRELLADGPLDLVVWPETAVVRGLRRPLPISGAPIREDLGVPLLFGGSAVDERDGRKVVANSAFLVAADGMIRDAYDKNLLIPFAEYMPLAAIAGRWVPHAQEFRAAGDTPSLRLGPWRIATPICYEAIRADFVRRMVRDADAHLIVTLANDAWFGDSAEPWMHLALVRLRAIEERRWIVRATNSGVSAVIDPAGRIVARTGLLTRENLRAVVQPLDGRTLYARLGDWPGWVAAVVVALGLARRRATT